MIADVTGKSTGLIGSDAACLDETNISFYKVSEILSDSYNSGKTLIKIKIVIADTAGKMNT